MQRCSLATAGLFVLLAVLVTAPEPVAQGLARSEIRLPDILGLRTLRCDFHIHTIFSDGKVWPSVRAEEAWRDGLDALALTEHVEYQPFKKDVSTDLNRSYEITLPVARKYGMTLVRGAEITRKMPPGHLNAIFLTDANKLKTEAWIDSLRAARDQGAFIFWNHPGWTGQQKDGVARWYDEHTDLYRQKLIHGIEVVNQKSYYPRVHAWCLEKKLTMMATSDVHAPIDMTWPPGAGEPRPCTLVFARDASPAAIREALFDRRTAVRFQDKLIGEARFLRPLFQQSIRVSRPALRLRPRARAYFRVSNLSDVPFTLERSGRVDGLSVPAKLVLPAGKTVLVGVRAGRKVEPGRRTVRIPFTVTNLLVAPGRGLELVHELEVTFEAPPAD